MRRSWRGGHSGVMERAKMKLGSRLIVGTGKADCSVCSSWKTGSAGMVVMTVMRRKIRGLAVKAICWL